MPQCFCPEELGGAWYFESVTGESWRNGYIESFNSRMRDEFLKSTCSGRGLRRGW
jgi:hypothetical protein